MRGRIIAMPAAAGVLAFLISLGCAGNDKGSPLPSSLQGLPLTLQIAGEEAKAKLAQLHGTDVAPEQSYIGYYGSGDNHSMLYVSLFDSRKEAQRMLNKMSRSIGKGRSGFGHHQEFDVQQHRIHMVLGPGQIHYFFLKDKSLYWLATHPRLARAALSQLLQVSLEDVPTLKKQLGYLVQGSEQ